LLQARQGGGQQGGDFGPERLGFGACRIAFILGLGKCRIGSLEQVAKAEELVFQLRDFIAYSFELLSPLLARFKLQA
jgi:hypothetical protein